MRVDEDNPCGRRPLVVKSEFYHYIKRLVYMGSEDGISGDDVDGLWIILHHCYVYIFLLNLFAFVAHLLQMVLSRIILQLLCIKVHGLFSIHKFRSCFSLPSIVHPFISSLLLMTYTNLNELLGKSQVFIKNPAYYHRRLLLILI